MFRAFSRSIFGSPEYHKEIRVQVTNYIGANRQQFKSFANEDLINIKIRDSVCWEGNQ